MFLWGAWRAGGGGDGQSEIIALFIDTREGKDDEKLEDSQNRALHTRMSVCQWDVWSMDIYNKIGLHFVGVKSVWERSVTHTSMMFESCSPIPYEHQAACRERYNGGERKHNKIRSISASWTRVACSDTPNSSS